MIRHTRPLLGCLLLLGIVCDPAWAATVRYNVIPASNRNARVRTIKTGSRIKYYINVEVLSDTSETDNSGLGLFNINVITDLTVAQPPATEFIPLIRDNFTLFPSRGQSLNDDITGIGAAQSTFSTSQAVVGIGQRGAQDLVNGFFQAPSVAGEFTVVIDAAASTANVLTADFAENGGAISAREITAGPGFTIITADDAPEDPGDEFDPFQDIPDSLRFGMVTASVGIFGLAVIIGLVMLGPWGAALGVFIGALLGLISLFFNTMSLAGP